ncbi:MAG: hypothetical protein K8Q99_04335 [Acholeplasmataceae bacterium]|nr:hypothetical protein [Acholeplasmataceae bacterium]
MAKLAKKKKSPLFRVIALVLVSMLFAFIGYLIIFNLISVTADTSLYLSKLVDFAISVKTHLVSNYIFYSFVLLVMISILIPIYLKVKK